MLFQIFSVLEQHMMMLWIERQEGIMEKNIKMIWYSGKYLCFNLVKCLVFWTLILFSFIHFQRRQHFLQCSVTTLINIRLKLTCHLKINNQHTVILLVILLVKFYQVDWQKQMRTVWDISHTTNCQLWSHNVGTCRPGHTNNFESWLLKYTKGVICFANDTIPKGFIILNDEAISKCWGRGSSYKK